MASSDLTIMIRRALTAASIARIAGKTGVRAGRAAVRGVRRVPAPVGISAVFTGAGAMHFARPDFFEAVVPDWFPSAKFANVASGAAEVTLGLLTIPRATRRPALWGLAAVTVIVFPANVDMAVNDVEVKLEDGRFVRSVGTADAAGRVVNWARLPMQLPLLVWIVREARRS